METTLGYHRATIAILDEKEKVVKKHIIEGDGKGGVMSAKINGLGSPTTTVDASDGIYYTASSGVGKVTAELAMVELTQEQKADFFGMTLEKGVLKHGIATRAPYVTILLESEGLKGQSIYIALLKGKLTSEGVELQTGTSDKGKDVQTISISGSFETRGADGNAYMAAHSDATEFLLTDFEKEVFPEPTV